MGAHFRGFDDPPRRAATASTEDEALDRYRRVRDEIRALVEELPRSLGVGPEPGPGVQEEAAS